MDHIHHYASPLGGITLASDGEALVGLWFDGQGHFGSVLDAAHDARALAYLTRRIAGWTPISAAGHRVPRQG